MWVVIISDDSIAKILSLCPYVLKYTRVLRIKKWFTEPSKHSSKYHLPMYQSEALFCLLQKWTSKYTYTIIALLDFCMATSICTIVADSNKSQQIILVKIMSLYNAFALDTSDLACLVGYIRQDFSHCVKIS